MASEGCLEDGRHEEQRADDICQLTDNASAVVASLKHSRRCMFMHIISAQEQSF